MFKVRFHISVFQQDNQGQVSFRSVLWQRIAALIGAFYCSWPLPVSQLFCLGCFYIMFIFIQTGKEWKVGSFCGFHLEGWNPHYVFCGDRDTPGPGQVPEGWMGTVTRKLEGTYPLCPFTSTRLHSVLPFLSWGSSTVTGCPGWTLTSWLLLAVKAYPATIWKTGLLL